MGSTLDLRAAVKAKLDTYVTNTSYRHTTGTKSGIWCIYDLEDFSYGENVNQVRLEVNLLEKSEDSSSIEDKADLIWNGLDHWDYLSGNIGFSCYQNVRNNIAEDDKTLQHRRLVFSIRLFRGGL